MRGDDGLFRMKDGSEAPPDATVQLGSGTLEPSEARMGTIAVKVPRGRSVGLVVLTDGAGTVVPTQIGFADGNRVVTLTPQAALTVGASFHVVLLGGITGTTTARRWLAEISCSNVPP